MSLYIDRVVLALLLTGAILCLSSSGTAAGSEPNRLTVTVRDFVPERGVCRAKRASVITATVENTSEDHVTVEPRLQAPEGIRIISSCCESLVRLRGRETRRLSWTIDAAEAVLYKLKLQIVSGVATVGEGTLDLLFLPPEPIRKLRYIPDPRRVSTSMLIGVGPVNPNDFPLCLGSYAKDHVAYFTGLLDEVRLYGRALRPDEARAHANFCRPAEPTPKRR